MRFDSNERSRGTRRSQWRPWARPATFAIAVLVAVAASAPAQIAPRPAAAADACVVAVVDSGASPLAESLRDLPEVDYWIEADRELLLCARAGSASSLDLATRVERAGATVAARLPDVRPERLRFWRGGRRLDAQTLGRVLAAGGRWAVVELAPWSDELAPPAAPVAGPGPGRIAARLLPFVPDLVLARRSPARDGESGESLGDPQIAALLGELDAARWYAAVSTLAGWNRWTRGSQILSARDWIATTFEALDGLSVVTTSFPVGANTGWNVIGTLRGTRLPDDWYVVGAHYDSTSENPSSLAPGAEDNASGCAGVLELARLFSAHPPDATMIFVCFSGEEQGLYGSSDYVDDLLAAGDLPKVKGALILDMIGFTADAELDCLLETEPFGATWMGAFSQAAAQFTTLSIVQSLSAWGSDHEPFLDAGRPAMLAIENDWNVYPHYHKTTDLPAHLSQPMALQILRMGAAGLLRTVGSNVLFTDGYESGGRQRWSGATP